MQQKVKCYEVHVDWVKLGFKANFRTQVHPENEWTDRTGKCRWLEKLTRKDRCGGLIGEIVGELHACDRHSRNVKPAENHNARYGNFVYDELSDGFVEVAADEGSFQD